MSSVYAPPQDTGFGNKSEGNNVDNYAEEIAYYKRKYGNSAFTAEPVLIPDHNNKTGQTESALKALAVTLFSSAAINMTSGGMSEADYGNAQRAAIGAGLKTYGIDADRHSRKQQFTDLIGDGLDASAVNQYIMDGDYNHLVRNAQRNKTEKGEYKQKYKAEGVTEAYLTQKVVGSKAYNGSDILGEREGKYKRSYDPNTDSYGAWVFAGNDDPTNAKGSVKSEETIIGGKPVNRFYHENDPKTTLHTTPVYDKPGKGSTVKTREVKTINENGDPVIQIYDTTDPTKILREIPIYNKPSVASKKGKTTPEDLKRDLTSSQNLQTALGNVKLDDVYQAAGPETATEAGRAILKLYTPYNDAISKLSRVEALLFMDGIQSMRGLGALSNAEGQKVSAAAAGLFQTHPETGEVTIKPGLSEEYVVSVLEELATVNAGQVAEKKYILSDPNATPEELDAAYQRGKQEFEEAGGWSKGDFLSENIRKEKGLINPPTYKAGSTNPVDQTKEINFNDLK